jgi:voltage-gated potassium channel
MKNKKLRILFSKNLILTITVFLYAFIVPALPLSWGRIPARYGILIITITGVFSIDRKKWKIVILALGIFILDLLSFAFDLAILSYISKFLYVIYFLAVVINLIRQIAIARVVTSKEILEAISGYILVGIIYSVLISFIMVLDPGAYNVVEKTSDIQESYLYLSTSMYYGFVSMAGMGYGDIVPLKPYTRSLATFIGVSGQFYIAILISMLVGKYISRKVNSSEHQE